MRHALEFFWKTVPTMREPSAEDGADIWALVRACKPLDQNSMYCNLLQCDHFRETCVVAEFDGEIVGWVSAYILPYDPETLFVWQVAVSETSRGMGLGGKMLSHLLDRDACADVERLQTTITSDNAASWALFEKFAGTHGAKIDSQSYFTQSQHFRDRHKTENLVTIDLEAQVRKAA